MLLRKKAPTTDFPKLMDAFCAKAGLEPLIPDAQGRYIIELIDDDRPVFCFTNSKETGTIHSSVITVPSNNARSSEMILSLLSGVAGILKSRDDVLCLDKENNEIEIFRRFSLRTATAEYLYTVIEDFVNSLDFFRQTAISGSTAGPAAARAGRAKTPAAPFMMRI